MKQQLAPCPFCGKPPVVDTSVSNPAMKRVWCINHQCDVQPKTPTFDGESKAVRVWNKRHKDKQLEIFSEWWAFRFSNVTPLDPYTRYAGPFRTKTEADAWIKLQGNRSSLRAGRSAILWSDPPTKAWKPTRAVNPKH